jgi:hypothetical protein
MKRSISLCLSSLSDHFRTPMPSIGRPAPMPFICRFLIDVRVMKFSRLVDTDADAPVSTQIRSTDSCRQTEEEALQVFILRNRSGSVHSVGQLEGHTSRYLQRRGGCYQHRMTRQRFEWYYVGHHVVCSTCWRMTKPCNVTIKPLIPFMAKPIMQ